MSNPVSRIVSVAREQNVGDGTSGTGVTVSAVSGFAAIPAGVWERLLSQSSSNVVFLTPEWQETWWQVYGRGQLLLLFAKQEGEPKAIAPLFADDDGMVYFVGSGGCGSDYLDFIGDISGRSVLDKLLAAAIEAVDNFVGFRFYLVPNQSATGTQLRAAAARLGLDFCEEDQMAAPVVDLRSPEVAAAVVARKSLRRHDRFFEQNGGVLVNESSRSDDILPHLDEFFDQHVERWASTPYPSLFLDARHRTFYERLTRAASPSGWLRFTRIVWQGRAVATHFGFCRAGTFLWYKPAFAIDLARRSPGEVLLRRLLLSAIDAGVSSFDFGIGDEPFKHRFATSVPTVKTWGLYAAGAGRA